MDLTISSGWRHIRTWDIWNRGTLSDKNSFIFCKHIPVNCLGVLVVVSIVKWMTLFCIFFNVWSHFKIESFKYFRWNTLKSLKYTFTYMRSTFLNCTISSIDARILSLISGVHVINLRTTWTSFLCNFVFLMANNLLSNWSSICSMVFINFPDFWHFCLTFASQHPIMIEFGFIHVPQIKILETYAVVCTYLSWHVIGIPCNLQLSLETLDCIWIFLQILITKA